MKIKKIMYVVITCIIIVFLYIFFSNIEKFGGTKENKKEYENLRRYYDDYKDEYALVLIRDMYESGKLSSELIEDLKNTTIFEIDKANFEAYKETCERWREILNYEFEELPFADEQINEMMYNFHYFANDGMVLISLFNTEEKRDIVENGLNIIKEWQSNPTQENRELVEDMYFSEKLTPSEIVVLFTWMNGNPDQLAEVNVGDRSYTIYEYFAYKIEKYGTSIGIRAEEARRQIVELNNIPNSEKDQSQIAYSTDSEGNLHIFELPSKDNNHSMYV